MAILGSKPPQGAPLNQNSRAVLVRPLERECAYRCAALQSRHLDYLQQFTCCFTACRRLVARLREVQHLADGSEKTEKTLGLGVPELHWFAELVRPEGPLGTTSTRGAWRVIPDMAGDRQNGMVSPLPGTSS